MVAQQPMNTSTQSRRRTETNDNDASILDENEKQQQDNPPDFTREPPTIIPDDEDDETTDFQAGRTNFTNHDNPRRQLRQHQRPRQDKGGAQDHPQFQIWGGWKV